MSKSGLLSKLLVSLRTTASTHKKKIIAVAILLIGFAIARKKLKGSHIISAIMFFARLSSQVMSLLPTPVFAGYRTILPFSYQPQNSLAELEKVMDISLIKENMKVFAI